MSYFGDRLLKLLPQLYRLEDGGSSPLPQGDLAAFLGVFAPTLDALKEKIDAFPVLFDLANVPAQFLPFLGALVGYPYDPTRDPELQRKLIRFRIEFYRRKGSRASVERILAENDVDAEVIENEPWEGVYKIPVDEPPLWLAPLLEEVHPAGTKWVFYCTRVCWATAPQPETQVAQVQLLAATGSAPAAASGAALAAVPSPAAAAPAGFCLMSAILV